MVQYVNDNKTECRQVAITRTLKIERRYSSSRGIFQLISSIIMSKLRHEQYTSD